MSSRPPAPFTIPAAAMVGHSPRTLQTSAPFANSDTRNPEEQPSAVVFAINPRESKCLPMDIQLKRRLRGVLDALRLPLPLPFSELEPPGFRPEQGALPIGIRAKLALSRGSV